MITKCFDNLMLLSSKYRDFLMKLNIWNLAFSPEFVIWTSITYTNNAPTAVRSSTCLHYCSKSKLWPDSTLPSTTTSLVYLLMLLWWSATRKPQKSFREKNAEKITIKHCMVQPRAGFRTAESRTSVCSAQCARSSRSRCSIFSYALTWWLAVVGKIGVYRRALFHLLGEFATFGSC